MSRQKTLEGIIRGSVELFNRYGASEVSTNRIAEHLEISPGNLYYYFPNKEAIIREIFAEVRSKIEPLWQTPTDQALHLVKRYVQTVFAIIFGYRFFFAELPNLLRRDEALKEDYWRFQSRFKHELAAVFLRLSEAGILKPFTEDGQRMMLANSIWIVTIYWHCYRETTPEEDHRPAPHNLLMQIMFLLNPYLEHRFAGDVSRIFMNFIESETHE